MTFDEAVYTAQCFRVSFLAKERDVEVAIVEAAGAGYEGAYRFQFTEGKKQWNMILSTPERVCRLRRIWA